MSKPLAGALTIAFLTSLTTGCYVERQTSDEYTEEQMFYADLPAGETQAAKGEDPDLAKQYEERGWRIYGDRHVQTNAPMVVLEAEGELTTADFELMAKSKVATAISVDNDVWDDAALAAIAELPTLEYASILSDKVTDEGIKSLAKCESLVLLFVSGEQITDEAIRPLAKLPKLETMILLRGSLSGECFADFADSESLKKLQLNNQYQMTNAGARHIAKLPNLRSLDIAMGFPFGEKLPEDNLSSEGIKAIVEGNFPPHFVCDPRFVDDELFVKMLDKGWIPSGSYTELSSPEELQYLDLEGYKLGDAGFQAALRFRAVTTMSIRELTLSQEAFAGVANLQAVTTMKIDECKIPGAAFDALTKLPITELELQECELSEEHFKAIGKIAQLEKLSLESSKYEPGWMKHLSGLKQLKALNVSEAPIDAEAAAILKNLPALAELNANNTKLDDEGFELLLQSDILNELRLDFTKVTKEVYQAAKEKHAEKSLKCFAWDRD